MFRIMLSIVTKWEWTQWMFFHLVVSDTYALIAIDQPPVIVTALGHDVTLPCKLNHDEEIMSSLVLYWWYTNPENNGKVKLWRPTDIYKDRVDLLDQDQRSPNKSILFKNVEWADAGKYMCKISVAKEKQGERFRREGNGTSLFVHDTMTFDLTNNNSLLCCEVNVTSNSGFVLSIFHNGCKLQTVDSAPRGSKSDQPYVLLSETVPLADEGKYGCQLHLNKDLVTESIFHRYLPESGRDGGVDQNVSVTCPTTVPEPNVREYLEPWHLYAAVLLVPGTTLLALVTALLMCRR